MSRFVFILPYILLFLGLKNTSFYRGILLYRDPILASKFIIGQFQSHQSDS